MRNTPNRNDELLNIHNRLLDEDPLATYDMFDAAVPLIERHLKFRFPSLAPGIDRDIYTLAAYQALTDYFKSPNNYDPQKRGLKGYLEMIAYRDMQNLLQKEYRRIKRTASLDVALHLSDGNNLSESVIDDIEAKRVFDEWTRDLTPPDRNLLSLMVDGERSTEAAAQALDITHLPTAERAREVKKAKDRLKKRLQRRGLPL